MEKLNKAKSEHPGVLHYTIHADAWIIVPARKLLGDMLIESGKQAEAMAEYESACQSGLKITTNRFNSLYGAGYATELAGNRDRAKFYYSELIQNIEKGKSNRPLINQTKSFPAIG